MHFGNHFFKVPPAILVLASFLAAIVFGTILLMLPAASVQGHTPFIDALFTATSAVCVTGLIVVDTGTFFTLFGQIVILLLIQIGGIGVMTVSVFLFRWIGRNIPYTHRRAMQDLFTHTPREDILKIVTNVISFSIIIEFLGAILLTTQLRNNYHFPTAFYHSLFHSVSAFCNAGFSTFSDSMMSFRGNGVTNSTICALIIAGGIGFPVMHDIKSWILTKNHKKRTRLSVQTKTVILTTITLITMGSILFYTLESTNILKDFTAFEKMLASIFQSITARTAGFNTIDISQLQDATLFLLIFLMFFGASPGSCGGGVKTTTLALLVAFTWSRVLRKRRVNLFKKSIPHETLTRTMSLLLVSIAIIGVVLFLMLAGDSTLNTEIHLQNRTFLAYLFETVSAFGTVGLSMGITSQLSNWDKLWTIFLMIVGRIGVLTFAYIVVGAGPSRGVEHSEENIMVG